MIITELLAQQIVDTVTCLVSCNVNIMNCDGVIIGTAHPARRQTFHKGAREVAESGLPVEIQRGEIPHFSGALEGVNLPITLAGSVVGVIGVTGSPDEVRGIAQLTKMVSELILEREQLHRESGNRQRLIEQLVEMMLWSGAALDRNRIVFTAGKIGFDISASRALAVADITALVAEQRSQFGDSELIRDRAIEMLLNALWHAGVIDDQDLATVADNRLIVFKSLPPDRQVENAQAWGNAFEVFFGDYSGEPVPCGIGAVAAGLDEYAVSYRQALFCIRNGGHGSSTIVVADTLVGWLLEEAVDGEAGMALRPWLERLRSCLGGKPEIQATALALLANNFEPKATAFALDIHRNTLTYRLARLKELAGLDVMHSHADAVLLRMLMAHIDEQIDPASISNK